MHADVHRLEAEWARVKYQVKDEGEQLTEIESLKKQADAVVRQYPGQAEPLLWDGIVTSENAALANIFQQLGLAKEARGLFERALAIDPSGLNGAISMSLGVLYYRVPGSPLGFGDDDMARKDLETALAKDPNGLDANYFYGDFLVEQGEYDKARNVLVHALDAPVDKERPVWDAGRREEVRQLIAKAEAHVRS
ncbi:tetratricopeptide repeat protein [Parvibaculum sedimenti]|uniref:Tetratricopeptide repeat protein n=2 Tax=Parvibaculum sedimenti TaxID=2608632 RepID=A0A6N6VJJ3_9HYPH|nr:tetratricopeptide repeat protein [Parvibaculum sedimenti]